MNSVGLAIPAIGSVLVAMMLAGCREAVAPQEGGISIDKLTAFVSSGPNGASARLDSMTEGFEWERVYAFKGVYPKDFMEKAVGQKLQLNDKVRTELSSDSTLLVFLQGDRITHMDVIVPPLWLEGTMGKGLDREQAILVVHTKDPGPYSAFRFKD